MLYIPSPFVQRIASINGTVTLILGLFMSSLSASEPAEFPVHQNDLIYDTVTMRRLAEIAAQRNHEFTSQKREPTHHSKFQCWGHYVRFVSKDYDFLQLKKQLDVNPSFQEIVQAYQDYIDIQEQNVLIVLHKYHDYENNDVVGYEHFVSSAGRFRAGLQYTGQPEVYDQHELAGTWRYSSSYSQYSGEYSVSAYYFTEDFIQVPLPMPYSRMVHYADVLIGTAPQQVFEQENFTEMRSPIPQDVQNFLKLLKYPGEPQFKGKYDADNVQFDREAYQQRYDAYRSAHTQWAKERLAFIDTELSRTPQFMRLLENASAAALKAGGSNDEFEYFVAKYLSKEQALQLKRGRTVMGTCSQDPRPRIHARNIAMLAAETLQWNIFLRAHLDILNDRFSRGTDGSYAWGTRKTYLRELEVLGIHVSDLLLGISFALEDASETHYQGTIHRVGRAFSEVEDFAAFSHLVLSRVRSVYDKAIKLMLSFVSS